MSTYLITRAGRGIGLELMKQLEKIDGDKVSKVFAITRGQPSPALSELIAASSDRVVHIPCKVTKPESIEKAVALLSSESSGGGLDVLVNNVGVSTASDATRLSIFLTSVRTRCQNPIRTAYVQWQTKSCWKFSIRMLSGCIE